MFLGGILFLGILCQLLMSLCQDVRAQKLSNDFANYLTLCPPQPIQRQQHMNSPDLALSPLKVLPFPWLGAAFPSPSTSVWWRCGPNYSLNIENPLFIQFHDFLFQGLIWAQQQPPALQELSVLGQGFTNKSHFCFKDLLGTVLKT